MGTLAHLKILLYHKKRIFLKGSVTIYKEEKQKAALFLFYFVSHKKTETKSFVCQSYIKNASFKKPSKTNSFPSETNINQQKIRASFKKQKERNKNEQLCLQNLQKPTKTNSLFYKTHKKTDTKNCVY